ncbi:MAG: hypothetical protein ACE5KY_03135, partial [Candidatus Tectimicrobiota bacterium]
MGRRLRLGRMILLGFVLALPAAAWAALLALSSPEAVARLVGLEAVAPAHQLAVQELLEDDPLPFLITPRPFRTT